VSVALHRVGQKDLLTVRSGWLDLIGMITFLRFVSDWPEGDYYRNNGLLKQKENTTFFIGKIK